MREGTADKQYTLTIEAVGTLDGKALHTVTATYGSRGGTLTKQLKTPSPVIWEEAIKIYQKTLNEKFVKGYKLGVDVTPIQSSAVFSKAIGEADTGSVLALDFIDRKLPAIADYKPMLLNSIVDPEPYLKSRAWVMQEKADGVHAVIHATDDGVRAYSRVGMPVAITAATSKLLAQWFEGCILDSEVIGDRIVVFDLLSRNAVDLRGLSCVDRLRELASLFACDLALAGSHVRMIHTAHTVKEKREMLTALHADGAEGAVFKKAAAPYRAGRPNSTGPALKLKFKATCSVRVHAIGTKGKESVCVELADGTHVASVSTLGRPIPKLGDIIEVEYLYAHRNGGLTQPVYKSIRTDVGPDTDDKLQYKGQEG
jgi:bifunctional non-homologous end joining protein LigD